MKALTGLPTSAYLRISEEAKIPLSNLLNLVQELEAGLHPAYLAYYRPDLCAGLDLERLGHVHERLHHFLDLEDRRITVLTAIGRQGALTPELRERIEAVTDRWELEDFYQPYKPKRRTAADEAIEKGLEPLARSLWEQTPEDADPATLAAAYVNVERGVLTVAEALRLARHLVARWMSEDAGIRGELRRIVHDRAELVVVQGETPDTEAGGRRTQRSLVGYRSPVKRVPWRQLLAIRRAAKVEAIRQELILPENLSVASLLQRTVKDKRSPFCLQLGAAARDAFYSYLAPILRHELTLSLDERCDNEAVQVFRNNLRKLLMAPPAGRITVVGLETGRAGGWRAAVVGPDGGFLEAAIVDRSEKQGAEESGGKQPADGEEGEASSTQEKTSPDSGEEAGVAPQTAPAAEDKGETSASSQEASAPNEGSEPQSESDSVPVRETESGATGSPAPPEEEAEAAASSGTAGTNSGGSADATASSEAAETAAEPESRPVPGAPVANGKGTPREPDRQPLATPRMTLSELLAKHQVDALVMANGPGVRQVERVIRGAVREAGAPKVYWAAISDAGSWVYATSKTARREFPRLEPAVRSAICLARRLQDPLAELVRVEPRVLGVGQFHHEADQRKLRAALRATVESCVCRVGVDLNCCSVELLSLVPGMTERLARRVIEHRTKHGRFLRRQQLRDVSGLSDRIYKQAVGFVRVYESENLLDGTAIHPEQYSAAEKIVVAAGVAAAEALANPKSLESVNLAEIPELPDSAEVLQSIVRHFQPSVRRPRGVFVPPEIPVELRSADELKVGMKVHGVVTNIADFGAFVDIGADQDGLVHVSQLSDEFVKDPKSAVKVGDQVMVHILALDEGGKRISLSIKEPRSGPRRGRDGPPQRAGDARRRGEGGRRRRKEPQRDRGSVRRVFGPDAGKKAREDEQIKNLTLEQKLALLETKYKTKV